jgi:glycosyltransferase 2 family protein
MSAHRQLALKLLLACVVLGVLLYFVPLAELGAALGAVAPGIFVVAVLLQFLMRIVATPRMRVITANQGMSLSHLQLFRIQLISQYYALMLPGTLAGGGATWMKYVQAGGGKSAAIAAVTLNRGIGTVVMLVTGGVAWLIDRGLVESPGMTALVLLCAALILAAIFGRLPWTPSDAPLPSGPAVRGWLRVFAIRLLLFQQVPPRGKLVVLLSSLAHELVGALTLWCFALAVGLSLDLLTVLWMRAALQLVLMAPLHIAGLGLREASLVGLGILVGAPPAVALAWSLAIFAGSLVVSAVGGLLEANAAARYLARPAGVSVTGASRDSKP